MTRVQIKRVYEAAAHEDGCRVLIDRLWPRGVSKEALVLQKFPEHELSRLTTV